MSRTDKPKPDGWSKADKTWKRTRRRIARAKAADQLRHHHTPAEHWRVELFDFADWYW